jgi:Tubulin-tyrosine ligase family
MTLPARGPLARPITEAEKRSERQSTAEGNGNEKERVSRGPLPPVPTTRVEKAEQYAEDPPDAATDADSSSQKSGEGEGEGNAANHAAAKSKLDPRSIRDSPAADGDDYDLCFTITKTWSKERFARMTPVQKVNFMPGHGVICVKTKLHRSISDVRARNPAKWDFAAEFWPRGYCLPENYHELLQYWAPKEKAFREANMSTAIKDPEPAPGFILKPPNAARGMKIRLAGEVASLPAIDDPYIVKETPLAQEYIQNPLTICGYKCSFRVFVAVTGVDPMRCFVYSNGLARITHKPYIKDMASMKEENLEVHLTNCDIAKTRAEEEALEEFQLPSPEGDGLPFFFLKSDIKSVLRWYEEKTKGVADPKFRCDAAATWQKIEDVCLQMCMLANGALTACVKRDVRYRWNAYELLGADIMLDDQFNPWLLECNHSPVLSPDGYIANEVKVNMLRDLFVLVDAERNTRDRYYAEHAELKRSIGDFQAETATMGTDANPALVAEPDANCLEYSKRQGLLVGALKSENWCKFALLLVDYDIMALFHTEFEQRARGGWNCLLPSARVRELDLDWLLLDGGRKQRLPMDRNFVALEMAVKDLTLSRVLELALEQRATLVGGSKQDEPEESE